ncbi:MAG: hypothetical protein KBB53_10535, partial [Steroidobacteraceae bacterium]|nr:hypothetical protein [Steroidobacteraceae bacterium]
PGTSHGASTSSRSARNSNRSLLTWLISRFDSLAGKHCRYKWRVRARLVSAMMNQDPVAWNTAARLRLIRPATAAQAAAVCAR